MNNLTPISFRPLFLERVWGGRRLETLYGKALPPNVPIGESWEVVDRPEAESIVLEGPWKGLGLHTLWSQHRSQVFGADYGSHPAERFPLLVKLLDARDKLSVQVHPPTDVAQELGGEPKTEMWHVLDAGPDADIFAGLKAGVTKTQFEQALEAGTVADCIHRIPTRPGDTIFIPSGRIHAIGAGNVILEVQQNSDTTFRVFDWNRVGLDGKPRALHIRESIQSADFNDFEPRLVDHREGRLIDCPLFCIERLTLHTPHTLGQDGRFVLAACIHGTVTCGGCTYRPGEFFLLSAEGAPWVCSPEGAAPATLLTATLPVHQL